MKKEQDYLEDLRAVRQMMERSTKFQSVSGWAGVLAGVYSLVAAFWAYFVVGFRPTGLAYSGPAGVDVAAQVLWVGLGLLALALATAVYLSRRRARQLGQRMWNPTSRRLVGYSVAPLLGGGVVLWVLWAHGLWGLMPGISLVFYGLALQQAGLFTYVAVGMLGWCMLCLGVLALLFPAAGLLLWALGFGLLHMVYGIYIHLNH